MNSSASVPSDVNPTPRVVWITGAGQGIGLGLAQAFARAGDAVLLTDLDGDKAERAAAALRAEGLNAQGMAADVCRPDDAQTQVAAAVRHWGRLDVAICNAGISQVKPFMDLTADDWQRMLQVNVTGTFLTLQAAAAQMLLQPGPASGGPKGRIITLASIAGRYGAGPIASVIAPYRASKAAVISLTQSAAISFAPHLTVNAICPGIVQTDMWTQMDRDWTTLQGVPQGEALKGRIAAIPMGRGQTPADVASVAQFLASSGADYMTGQSINVDGGLMMS